jgi:hypothetical protein
MWPRPWGDKSGYDPPLPRGARVVWAQCPLVAARKLAAAGKVKVGWVWEYLEYLTPRQLQCYRCLEIGHTKQRCTNDVDRSGRCYRCGDTSHRAAECASAAAKCPLCADLGRPADHRMGGRRAAPHSPPGEGVRPHPTTGAGPFGDSDPREEFLSAQGWRSRKPQPPRYTRSEQSRLPLGPATNRARRAAIEESYRQDPGGS